VNSNITTRPINPSEHKLLEEFLYQAIYIPKGETPPPRDVIFDPNVYVYIKNFGSQKGDHCIVAEHDDKVIGAAWARIIPAYGHLDETTPELAISILPNHRSQGVGTALMEHLFETLRQNGYARTSLSVQTNNPAVRFYKRLGYEITQEKLDHVGNEDYIMVKQL